MMPEEVLGDIAIDDAGLLTNGADAHLSGC